MKEISDDDQNDDKTLNVTTLRDNIMKCLITFL